jgi:hypothetical protein
VQHLSVRSCERLAGNDIVASVARGDSYDGDDAGVLLRSGLIQRHGPWRALDDVAFAALTYIDWFNHRRLHGAITDDATGNTPTETLTAYHRHASTATEAVDQRPQRSRKPGASLSADEPDRPRPRCGRVRVERGEHGLRRHGCPLQLEASPVLPLPTTPTF